jgi:hypothetical protein
MPLSVSISRATDVPIIKLPEGKLPGLIVPELKQDLPKVTAPLSSKLPPKLALP